MKRFVRKAHKIWVASGCQHLWCAVDMLIVRIFSCSPSLSTAYYLIFNRSFDREHHAVLHGRLSYSRSLDSIGRSSVLLRRNIHRLEKGLIMRPRRPVFGEGFIEETVKGYEKAIMSDLLCKEERKWAEDVLDNYFSVVGGSAVTDHARHLYLRIRPASGVASDDSAKQGYSPYSHSELPPPAVSFEQIELLFRRRRSVRWYQDVKVPFDLIQRAVDIASLAPSACNRQPYRFLVCTKKEKAVEIAKCAGGTRGFADNIPAIIVLTGDLSAYPYEKDRHLIYIDGALASMQLMLALETLGLSTCSINWPDVNRAERRIQKLLQLPVYERVLMLIAVGYADREGGIPYSQKKKGQLLAQEIV